VAIHESPEKTGDHGVHYLITRKNWRFMNHQKKLAVMAFAT